MKVAFRDSRSVAALWQDESRSDHMMMRCQDISDFSETELGLWQPMRGEWGSVSTRKDHNLDLIRIVRHRMKVS